MDSLAGLGVGGVSSLQVTCHGFLSSRCSFLAAWLADICRQQETLLSAKRTLSETNTHRSRLQRYMDPSEHTKPPQTLKP